MITTLWSRPKRPNLTGAGRATRLKIAERELDATYETPKMPTYVARVIPARRKVGVGHGINPKTGGLLCGSRLRAYLDLGHYLGKSDCKTCVKVAKHLGHKVGD
jgi:hypothetical protein